VQRRWIDSVLRGWDESVHDGALEFAESLGPGPERQWALYVVTRRRVLRDGPEAVIAWVESLPDDDATFKLNAFRRVGGAAAEVDPQRATDFAERHLDGPYGNGLARRVGMRWVEREPKATMGWLSGLPAGERRDDGVRETYRRWLGIDRVSARQWIRSVEHERWLDPAVSVYARGLGQRDPDEAVRVAGRIHDPALRQRALGVIARQWLIRDEAAANAWLDRSDLPPEFVARIRVIPGAVQGSSK
jgi:hypothetical protein